MAQKSAVFTNQLTLFRGATAQNHNENTKSDRVEKIKGIFKLQQLVHSNLRTFIDRDATEFGFCPGDCTRQRARAYSCSVPFDLSNSQSVDPEPSLFNPLKS